MSTGFDGNASLVKIFKGTTPNLNRPFMLILLHLSAEIPNVLHERCLFLFVEIKYSVIFMFLVVATPNKTFLEFLYSPSTTKNVKNLIRLVVYISNSISD